MQQRGRVTIPTDVDVVPETLGAMERWGRAIRDCDGTITQRNCALWMPRSIRPITPQEKDNTWAKAHPEEIQQMYIMTPFLYGGRRRDLQIHLMTHLYPDMLKSTTVMTLRVGGKLSTARRGRLFQPASGRMMRQLARDDPQAGGVPQLHGQFFSGIHYVGPVHMYNAVTNGWKDVEKQITRLMCANQRPTPTPWSGCAEIYRGASVCGCHPLHTFFSPIYAHL